ncbi:PTS sugar transporter subunit IIA [Croceicoccus hydrothermalis]|uniref:PTS sugar transporter subunit IIA n=1 Tax=Croceicoccus hydrothermalis TaxID=2867964 RepID=UPI001EFA7078|nr:PTS sugar transporter subunit IIA [Croceicoccus hydrothermalis]
MIPTYTIAPAAIGRSTAQTKAQLLLDLADRFAHAYRLDSAEVLAGLQEREKLGSTGFGRGVAMPHARIAGISEPVCALVRMAAPVDFDAADTLPVDLAFGLLSPMRAGAEHLHALAAISRLMRDDRVRERLIDAPNDDAAYALLSDGSAQDAA